MKTTEPDTWVPKVLTVIWHNLSQLFGRYSLNSQLIFKIQYYIQTTPKFQEQCLHWLGHISQWGMNNNSSLRSENINLSTKGFINKVFHFIKQWKATKLKTINLKQPAATTGNNFKQNSSIVTLVSIALNNGRDRKWKQTIIHAKLKTTTILQVQMTLNHHWLVLPEHLQCPTKTHYIEYSCTCLCKSSNFVCKQVLTWLFT